MVITGRLSIRDEKEPQIVINRAVPITDYAAQAPAQQEQPVQEKTLPGQCLYLKLTGENDPRYRKVKAIVNMFPGSSRVVVFFADDRSMRGAQATYDSGMIQELKNLLGEENVVLK